MRNRTTSSNFRHNAVATPLVLLMLSTISILLVPVSAAPGPCSLSVKVIPAGSGTVTLTPPGSPAGTYTPCVPVSFKATPSLGYYFVGWALSGSGSTQGDGNMWYFTYQNPTPNFLMNATNGGSQRLLAYFQQQNQWVRSSGNPILTVSASGWDDGFVVRPRVFTYPNGTYGMIYVGGSGSSRALGLATSTDGVHWTKYSGNPVLTASPGQWDSWGGGGRGQMAPGSVFWDGTNYRLYYDASNSTDGTIFNGATGDGKQQFGLATSPDGVHWTKHPSNPIFSVDRELNQHPGHCQPGSPPFGSPVTYFHFPSVVKVGGTYYMWYSRGGGIHFATSNDGVNWTSQNDGCSVLYPADWDDPGIWPNLPHAYSWDGDYVYYPSAFYDPVAHNFKLFYSGCDVDCAVYRTGFATSADGITWTKYAGNPALSPIAGGFDNADNIDNAAALLVNGMISVYYSADTVNSMVCRENDGSIVGLDPACSDFAGFTETSIGLASIAEVPLNKGWNLVSLPLVPNNNDIKSILAPLLSTGEVTVVWTYAGTPRAWQFFQPPALGTLKTMQDGNGYWIKMTTADTMLVGGNVIPPGMAPSTYSLLAGWNLVGFKPQPTLQNETVGQFLLSISGSYDSNHVWNWDNYAGAWIKADPTTWLVPGQALWVYVTSPTGAILRP